MSQSELSLFIRASLELYKECVVTATKNLVRGWQFILGSVGLYIIWSVLSALFGDFGGLAGGFILGFGQIALISIYYQWLTQLFEDGRLPFKELPVFNTGLFMNVIGAAFLLWIALLVVQLMTQGMGIDWLLILLNLTIVIVFNALPEVIYIDRQDGAQALVVAANFTRENWIEWFLPFVVVLAPLISIAPLLVLSMLSNSEVLLPVQTVVAGWQLIGWFQAFQLNLGGIILDLSTLLCLIPGSWLMLFRAQLYHELSRGTRRSRIYRMKQK